MSSTNLEKQIESLKSTLEQVKRIACNLDTAFCPIELRHDIQRIREIIAIGETVFE